MIKVGIADDHRMIIDAITSYSEHHNFDLVLEAKDGEDLLEKLKVRHAQGLTLDVLILDINMEPVSGTECLSIVKDKYKNIRIIVLSLYKDPKIVNHHVKLGADCYLFKTQAPRLLIDAIEKVYQEGYYITREVLVAIQTFDNKETFIERKKKLDLSKKEIKMIRLMFYHGRSGKVLADDLGYKSSGAVYEKRSRLYKKFRDIGESVHNELDLMRVAVQYGYVSVFEIEERLSKENEA